MPHKRFYPSNGITHDPNNMGRGRLSPVPPAPPTGGPAAPVATSGPAVSHTGTGNHMGGGIKALAGQVKVPTSSVRRR